MADHNSPLDDLNQRILSGIPLAGALKMRITALDDYGVEISAPLDGNYNVHGTGFAGSLYSCASLAAWSLTTHLIERNAIDADVVMSRAEIRYKHPVTGDIHCRCDCEPGSAESFLQHLKERGRARLTLVVDIGEQAEANLTASMVASLK